MFGGVYRRPVASDRHHRPKKSEAVAGLFVGGTGVYSHLEVLFQLEQPRSQWQTDCVSLLVGTNERTIGTVQVSVIKVGGGQYKDDLRMTLSYKRGRP